ncbi:hypothetical protein QTP88_025743 [Uroleucon formosanum]
MVKREEVGTVDKDEDNNIDKPLTPTKTYETSRSEMTELIFPSSSSITDTPKKIIKDLIHMPTPNSKRLIYADENDTPRKKKLKLKIDQQKIKLRCSFEKNNMKIAAFSDIVATYEIDKKNIKSKSLLKITEAHIDPSSFQKMRVKLAVQLFSHTMASTIRTCIETNELKSNTAKNTANFVDFINKLFDSLNSKTLYTSNPYNCGLSDSGVVKPFLNEAATYFINLQKNKKGKMTKPPCFKGANCENIIENTDYQTNEQVSILLEGEQINNIENDQSSDTNSECSVNDIDVLVPEDLNSISVTLGDCSVTYFAGYLAFKCIKKFSCENFKQIYTISIMGLEYVKSSKGKYLLVFVGYVFEKDYTKNVKETATSQIEATTHQIISQIPSSSQAICATLPSVPAMKKILQRIRRRENGLPSNPSILAELILIEPYTRTLRNHPFIIYDSGVGNE